MVTYVLLSILTSATCSRFFLQNDYLYLMPINVWPPFIAVGILTATFSASLSTLIGSSRVIEALARDNIYGSFHTRKTHRKSIQSTLHHDFFFSGNFLNIVIRGTWKSNPIAAVIISWICVQLMLLIGSLNTIAQINSILFLLAYFALNLACLGLELASAPNFRYNLFMFQFLSHHYYKKINCIKIQSTPLPIKQR